jgi:diacylglycerol kinase
MVVSGITVIVGLWLQIGTFSWALLVVALGAVWVTECLNTAIEASIDLGTSDPHPMAKVGKDVASAAALVSSLVFVMVVALILLPRLIEKLSSS